MLLVSSQAQDTLSIKKYEKSFLKEDHHFHYRLPIFIPHYNGYFGSGEASLEPGDEDDGNEDGDGGDESGGTILEKLFKKEFLNLEGQYEVFSLRSQ